MAKKGSKKKKVSKKAKSQKTDELKEVGHKIWLAGLGAVSLAEAEAARLLKTAGTQGSKFFKSLVEKGEAVEKKSKPTVDKLKAKATKARKDASKSAEAGWEKVEKALDDRITATLHRLGIPTKREIEQLTKRVETLTKKLDSAQKKTTRKTARKPAAKKTAKKTTRKRTTRKKTTKATSTTTQAPAGS